MYYTTTQRLRLRAAGWRPGRPGPTTGTGYRGAHYRFGFGVNLHAHRNGTFSVVVCAAPGARPTTTRLPNWAAAVCHICRNTRAGALAHARRINANGPGM